MRVIRGAQSDATKFRTTIQIFGGRLLPLIRKCKPTGRGAVSECLLLFELLDQKYGFQLIVDASVAEFNQKELYGFSLF